MTFTQSISWHTLGNAQLAAVCKQECLPYAHQTNLWAGDVEGLSGLILFMVHRGENQWSTFQCGLGKSNPNLIGKSRQWVWFGFFNDQFWPLPNYFATIKTRRSEDVLPAHWRQQNIHCIGQAPNWGTRLADTTYSVTGNRDLGQERQTQSWSSFCSQKSCAASKATIVQKMLQYLKYCWEHQQSTLWLRKSCPILGTSISISPYNIPWGTATRGTEFSENKTSTWKQPTYLQLQ